MDQYVNLANSISNTISAGFMGIGTYLEVMGETGWSGVEDTSDWI